MTCHDGAGLLSLTVASQEFEGPLDLLLEEVRRQNVPVENVVMAPIVARFLEYVATATERNLNLDIDWLHMAATLIHWKSQSLLPHEGSGNLQTDVVRHDLVQQLLAHRKQMADELARRGAVEETRFSRGAEEGGSTERADDSETPEFVSVLDLVRQARELADWVEQHRRARRQWRNEFEVESDGVTIGEMIDYLKAHLAAADGTIDSASLLRVQPTAARRSCLFLGMLEMARDRQVEIRQDDSFGPIWVTRLPAEA